MNKTISVLILSIFMISSCGLKKTPLTEEQAAYAGKWQSNDGTWIQIYNDGTGSLKSGNTSVEGGKTTITESEIEIGLFGIKKKYHIDQKPYEENGKKKMKLDGFIYEKVN